MELNTKHIYQLNATKDLPSGIILLAANHRIDHKYPKLLNISLLNTEYDAVHLLRKTVICKLLPIEIENIEVSNILWTKENSYTTNIPAEQPKQNGSKPLILLQDAQILQEAKDRFSSLLEEEYDSIVSKSPTDVGRTNLF